MCFNELYTDISKPRRINRKKGKETRHTKSKTVSKTKTQFTNHAI